MSEQTARFVQTGQLMGRRKRPVGGLYRSKLTAGQSGPVLRIVTHGVDSSTTVSLLRAVVAHGLGIFTQVSEVDSGYLAFLLQSINLYRLALFPSLRNVFIYLCVYFIYLFFIIIIMNVFIFI